MQTADPRALPAVVDFGKSSVDIVAMFERVAVEIERSTDIRFIGDQRERAEQATKMLRAIGEAQEAIIACIRFEIVCMRRIATLGAANLIASTEKRNIAIALAKADPREFAQVLDLVDERTTGVIGLSRSIRRLHDADADRRWAHEVSTKTPSKLLARPFDDMSIKQVHIAAREIVASAMVGDGIEINAATAEMIELLLGPAYASDGDAIDLCAAILRRSIEMVDRESVRQTGLPAFLTVRLDHEGAERWVRIPFFRATVGQYRWALAARERWLENATSAVEKWREVVAGFEGRDDDELAHPELAAKFS